MGAGSPGRGDQALAAKPHPGRTPFLTADQEKQVLGWLAEPPTKHGFGTDLWTAKRVAQLILQKLKVRFHPHYLREWLTTRNYPPEAGSTGEAARPGRDRGVAPEGLAADQKNVRRQKAHLVRIDETGLFLNPLAPSGRRTTSRRHGKSRRPFFQSLRS